MTLDDRAYDKELATSVLRALRDNNGVKGLRDIIDENSFSTGKLFTSVTDGATHSIYVENPPNSGKITFLVGSYSTSGKIYYHKTDSVTKDSSGTGLDVQNRILSDGTEVCNVESDVTHSGGNEWSRKVSGGASGEGQSGLTLAPGTAVGYDIVLKPGENVVYEFTNKAGTEIDANIDIDFVEVNEGVVPEL